MKPEKQMRVIQICFVLYAVGLIGIAYRLPSHATQKLSDSFQIIMGVIAVSCVFAGFRFQERMMRGANRSTQSEDPMKALKIWRAGHLVRLAFHVSVLLYGFVLHLLGGAPWLVDGLFALGLISLLTWTPGTVPIETPTVNPMNG